VSTKPDKVITTQRTSRDLKAWILVSIGCAFGGLWMLIYLNAPARGFGQLLFWFGMIAYIVTKVRIWWRNE
jgi:hypothetical protein